MWKISDTLWINPEHIATVIDYPSQGKCVLRLSGAPSTLDSQGYELYDQERKALLAFLSQHSVMHPPYIVRDDSDEPPF